MTQITHPMLASPVEDIETLHYPLLATPKLDGIRCVIVNGKALTRKFKPIPNHYVRQKVSQDCPDGFDGELVLANDEAFNEVSSAIMSEDGEPDFKYMVFDYYSLGKTYQERMQELRDIPVASFVKKVLPIKIHDAKDLLEFQKKCLKEGYEGVMMRRPSGPYKMGRATPRSEDLLKFKNFEQSEAVILGFKEKLTNKNPIKQNELGKNYRSSEKEGKVKANTLGGFEVKDLKTGETFTVGSGFDDKTRKEIWNNRDKYLGKYITYKFQKEGMIGNTPRFPIFVGCRHPSDF